MFWKIVGLIVSWIGTFVIVNVFGPRFNLVFAVPACLTLFFIYYRFVKKINFSEMKRGWILVVSVLCEIGILAGTCFLLKFLSLHWFLEIIIGLGGIATITVVGFLLIYFWWAPRNLFWTFVPEGRAKIVVKADEVRRVLIQWKDHVLAEQAVPDQDIDIGDVIDGDSPKRCFGGLRFYGWWPLDDIYIYDFSWTNVDQSGAIETHEKKTLDYVLLKEDIYLAVVENAEDKELLPVNIKLVLTIRVVNPYKAGFVIQNWLEAVINRMKPAVRDTFTKDTYRSWISTKKDLAGRIIKDKRVKGFLEQECRARYGIEIKAIEVMDIDPGEEYREATLAEYLAEREKAKTIIGAEAEKERLVKVAQGEAQRIEIVNNAIEKYGDLGKLIRILEALEKSPEKGSKLIILPGVTDLISQVFPGHNADSLESKELKWLKDAIKKLQQKKPKEKDS